MWLDRLFRTLPPATHPSAPLTSDEGDERTDTADLDEDTVVSMRPPVLDDTTLIEADGGEEPDPAG